MSPDDWIVVESQSDERKGEGTEARLMIPDRPQVRRISRALCCRDPSLEKKRRRPFGRADVTGGGHVTSPW